MMVNHCVTKAIWATMGVAFATIGVAEKIF
jgi:hypothetical protein